MYISARVTLDITLQISYHFLRTHFTNLKVRHRLENHLYKNSTKKGCHGPQGQQSHWPAWRIILVDFYPPGSVEFPEGKGL